MNRIRLSEIDDDFDTVLIGIELLDRLRVGKGASRTDFAKKLLELQLLLKS